MTLNPEFSNTHFNLLNQVLFEKENIINMRVDMFIYSFNQSKMCNRRLR